MLIERFVLATAVIVAAGGSGTAASQTPVRQVPGGGWVRSDLRPLSQPVSVNGVVIVYVKGPGGLTIMGVNGRTGTTLWDHPASPGDITPGVAPQVAVVDGLVDYVETLGPQWAIVAADPTTGATVWTSTPGVFTTWPFKCRGGHTAATCTTGSLSGSGTDLLGFSALNGGTLFAPEISPTRGARLLTDGLFDPGGRSPEELVAADPGGVTWTEPLSSVFNMPGMSTDDGWDLDQVKQLGMYVGSVGAATRTPTGATPRPGDEVTIELPDMMTAAFRMSDGAAVWQTPGTYYLCGYVTCPGLSTNDPTRPTGIRLRATGTASGTYGGTTVTFSPHADAVVEGFDLADGRTVWRFDAGRDLPLLEFEEPPQAAANKVVLQDVAGKPTTLDLANGKTSAPPLGLVAWCQMEVNYEEPVAYITNAGSTKTYTGQVVFPCNAAGKQVAPPRNIPRFVGTQFGATVDGQVVWSEATALIAEPLAA